MQSQNLLLWRVFLSLALGCPRRDFLTRRLAADLTSASGAFKAPQLSWLRTGIVSNKDFSSPASMVLQHRGWIIGTQQQCPAGVDPPPCWDVLLTPLGVDTIRPLISTALPDNGSMSIQVARRELVSIDGISKAGNVADVDFAWRWVPINQVGAALYDTGVNYPSPLSLRGYDDASRVADQKSPTNQTLNDALHNPQPLSPQNPQPPSTKPT